MVGKQIVLNKLDCKNSYTSYTKTQQNLKNSKATEISYQLIILKATTVCYLRGEQASGLF